MNSSQERNEKERSKERVKKETTTTTTTRARAGECEGAHTSEFAHALSKAWEHKITANDLIDAAEKIGMCHDEVAAWVRYMEEVGWEYANGRPISFRNFRRSLRMWHKVEESMQAERNAERKRGDGRRAQQNPYEEQKAREATKREQAATKDESWALCAERCANYLADGTGCNRCKQGFKVPPPVRERPCPPESCVMFVRIEEGGEV